MLKCVCDSNIGDNSTSRSHQVMHFPEAITSVESVSFVAATDKIQIAGQMLPTWLDRGECNCPDICGVAQTKDPGQ